jgi:LuxR family maltose regulon positive regulatory protein
LLCRSATTLEATGDLDAAMDLWIAAQNWDQATRLILREANGLLNSGRRQTLVRWIQGIRGSLHTDDPWLAYWLGRAQLQIAPSEGIKTLEHALELFRQSDDRQDRMECLTALLGGAFLGFHALDAMDPWIDELLVLIDVSPEFISENAELRIWGVLCMALFHVRPWHPLTVPAYRRVEDLLPSCADSNLVLVAAMHALVVSGLSGDFAQGDRIVSATESLAARDTASPSEAAWWFAQVGWLRFVEARYDEALDYLEKGSLIAESNGLRMVMRQIILWRFTVEWRVIGWSAASARLAEVEIMPRSSQPMIEATLQSFKARRAHHRGELAEAANLASLSHQAAMLTRSRLEEVVFGLSNADVLLEAGRIADAEPLITHARGLIERAYVYECFHAAASILQARCCLMRSDHAGARVRLREALAYARSGNGRYYLRFCDYAMPPLFRLALDEGIEVNLVQSIIRMFRLKPPKNASDSWPWQVRIITMGRFKVQIKGEDLEFSRKLPRKTLLLLKAIVAFGGRDVSEQALCDALWGDEEGDAARNALSITVLRLRKLLGSNESVLQQGGRISLNAQMCWVDVWVFEARLADTGFDSQNVLALYGGTFLPEDEGESWSVASRERLRGKFIDALSRYGTALEAEGDLLGAVRCYMRGIDADPIVESFHQGLMRCYERLGKRTEALSVYRRLKHTLSVVLGVPPSDAAQRLFQDMLRRQAEEGPVVEPEVDVLGADGTALPASGRTAGVVANLPLRRTRLR